MTCSCVVRFSLDARIVPRVLKEKIKEDNTTYRMREGSGERERERVE